MLLFLGVSMKIDRHGQAKILTQSEIQLLFSQGYRLTAIGLCLASASTAAVESMKLAPYRSMMFTTALVEPGQS
jgi:hypothetical protein